MSGCLGGVPQMLMLDFGTVSQQLSREVGGVCMGAGGGWGERTEPHMCLAGSRAEHGLMKAPVAPPTNPAYRAPFFQEVPSTRSGP